MRLLAPLCLLFAVLAFGGSTAVAQLPDQIFHHGKIVTVDEKFTIAEALAVRGDRIQAVGSNDDVLKLAGPKTKLIDLKGRTVIPGLIDSHVHAPGAAMYEFDHPIPEMDTVADVLKYIAARAEVWRMATGLWSHRFSSRDCGISGIPIAGNSTRRLRRIRSCSARVRTAHVIRSRWN